MNSVKNIAILFPGQGTIKDINKVDKKIIIDTKKALDNNISINNINIIYNTQLVQLLTFFSSLFLFKKKNITYNNIKILAGHSMGEYMALLVAQVITLEDTIYLIKKRGEYMQRYSQKGYMIVIFYNNSNNKIFNIVKYIYKNIGKIYISAFNSDKQLLISVEEKIYLFVKKKFKKEKIFFKTLMPYIPAHSPLMKKASKKFQYIINSIKFKKPKIPIIQNFNGKISYNINIIKNNLIKQLYYPVQWVKTIKIIKKLQISNIIEISNNKNLSHLLKDIK